MIVIPLSSYACGIGSAHSSIIESACSSGSGFPLFVEGMGLHADPGDLVYATTKIIINIVIVIINTHALYPLTSMRK